MLMVLAENFKAPTINQLAAAWTPVKSFRDGR
jgi:hypothetical protein